jgi:hypothetical protein
MILYCIQQVVDCSIYLLVFSDNDKTIICSAIPVFLLLGLFFKVKFIQALTF